MKKHCFPALAALLLTMSSSLYADATYRQNFGNNTGEYIPLSEAGWKTLYSSSKEPGVRDGEELNRHIIGISGNPGRPQDMPNINAADSPSDGQGFVSVRNGAETFYQALIFTDQTPLEPTKTPVESLQWMAAASNGGLVRAALRVGEQWYVSNEIGLATISDSGELFATQAKPHEVLVSGNEWFALTANPGNPFAVSSLAVDALPQGTITAFGLFVVPPERASSFVWFDTFAINDASVFAKTRPAPGSLLNIHDLGAKGDGIHDDTAIFQEALNSLRDSGGVLHVPAGHYRITRTLRIANGDIAKRTMNFTRIQGEGAASVLLGDGVDYILAAEDIPDDKGGRAYFNGLFVNQITFRSFDDQNRCGGIDASQILRWECNNSYFVNLNTGIFSRARLESGKNTSVWIIRISNNLFTGCRNYAIRMERIFDLVIENNTIEHGRGGIAVGTPGDKFDAAANTLRIVNNVIEGLTEKPAILGSCWIGSTISGNYFEANSGGDITLIPEPSDGGVRGITIMGNSFQPTKKQMEAGYGPILLKKAANVAIIGNFSTSPRLLHPDSSLGANINLASNSVANPFAVGAIDGASTKDRESAQNTIHALAEKWEVGGPNARVGIDSARGFSYQPRGDEARIIRYGIEPPQQSTSSHQAGDLVLNQKPAMRANNQVLLGWLCIEAGTPGVWKTLYTITE